MTARRRAPIVAAAFAVVGALCLGASVRAVSEPALAHATTSRALRTPVWSPRRVPAVFGAAIATSTLRRQVRQIAAPVASCVSVDGGLERDPLVRVAPSRALAGASTQKLLVAAAALATMGANHHFETRAVTSVRLSNGTLAGDLVVVGGGDPVLTTAPAPNAAADPHTSLSDLADAIVAAGVHHIDGALVADDSRFDRERAIPSWDPDDVAGGEVGALGALIVNGGRGDDGLADPQPARTTADELATMLTARGVEIAGGVRDPGGAATGGTHDLARVASPPLGQIVEQMLTLSNNETAELLTREIGHVQSGTGSTEAGTRAIPIVLSRLGVPVGDVDLHDGSGLSPADRVSCAALSGVVALGQQARFAPLLDGLAVAGRSGTLAGRFTGTSLAGRLRAKTGHISGVVGLAGVVDTTATRAAARVGARFAFLANGDFSTSGGETLQDRVATAIAAYVDEPSTPDPVPAPR